MNEREEKKKNIINKEESKAEEKKGNKIKELVQEFKPKMKKFVKNAKRNCKKTINQFFRVKSNFINFLILLLEDYAICVIGNPEIIPKIVTTETKEIYVSLEIKNNGKSNLSNILYIESSLNP